MRIFLVVFFIVLLLLVLMALPLTVNLKVHVNFVNLKCLYSIKVLGIKLLCGTTYIEDSRLIIQNTHNKIKIPEGKMDEQMMIMKHIIKKISVDKLNLFFTGGIKDDAYYTAMLCGYVYSISSALIAKLITKHNCINIYQDIDPVYNQDALDLTLKCLIQISILNVLSAVISAKKQYKELGYGKENK